jgi:hypothetical protein
VPRNTNFRVTVEPFFGEWFLTHGSWPPRSLIGIRVIKWGTLEYSVYVNNLYLQETKDKSVIFKDNNVIVCPEIYTADARST